MRTNKDYTVNYLHYGDIIVPEGTIVTNNTATGFDVNYHFVNEFGWIDKNYPNINNILKMDAMGRGINIPKEYITKEVLINNDAR